jgi:hypothetical protein
VRLSWGCRGDPRIAGTKKMRQLRIPDWVAHPMSRNILSGSQDAIELGM